MMLCFHADRFATRVRRWRGARTQQSAAADVGISRWALSRVECGEMPGVLVFMTLCRAMNEAPGQFVYERQGEVTHGLV